MLLRVKARPEHLTALAVGLRSCDRREILSASGRAPEDILADSLAISKRCWTAVDEHEQPVIIAGVAQGPMHNVGVPWMMATEAIVDHQTWVLRHTSEIVSEMHGDEFPILLNYCDARNKLHERWLRWGGFQFFCTTRDFAHDKSPFRGFVKVQL